MSSFFKKALCLILCFLFIFSLSSCAKSGDASFNKNIYKFIESFASNAEKRELSLELEYGNLSECKTEDGLYLSSFIIKDSVFAPLFDTSLSVYTNEKGKITALFVSFSPLNKETGETDEKAEDAFKNIISVLAECFSPKYIEEITSSFSLKSNAYKEYGKVVYDMTSKEKSFTYVYVYPKGNSQFFYTLTNQNKLYSENVSFEITKEDENDIKNLLAEAVSVSAFKFEKFSFKYAPNGLVTACALWHLTSYASLSDLQKDSSGKYYALSQLEADILLSNMFHANLKSSSPWRSYFKSDENGKILVPSETYDNSVEIIKLECKEQDGYSSAAFITSFIARDSGGNIYTGEALLARNSDSFYNFSILDIDYNYE